jgi:hypothetical protein
MQPANPRVSNVLSAPGLDLLASLGREGGCVVQAESNKTRVQTCSRPSVRTDPIHECHHFVLNTMTLVDFALFGV